MKRLMIRKAKALAVANRRSYLALTVGAAVGAALFVIALSVVPIGSPARMVRAQAVQGTPVPLETKTNGAAVIASIAGPATADPPATNPVPATPGSSAAPIACPAYLAIGFEKLAAFPFVVTDQVLDGTKDSRRASLDTLGQIPAEIKAFNEKQVSLRGFMLPMKFERGLTTEFLILKSQGMCCYGIPPKITEWVNVRTAGKGLKPIMDQPVTVCGTFHVGEVRENGDLVGIYSLDADKMKAPGE